MERYDVLKVRAQELESQHFSEIVVSFAAGGLTLLAALGALRVLPALRHRSERLSDTDYAIPSSQVVRRVERAGRAESTTYLQLHEVDETPQASLAGLEIE